MIYITGDTHGRLEKLSNKSFKTKFGKTLSGEDSIIILGDFGCVWATSDRDKEKEKRYVDSFSRSLKGKLFVVLGNHENYDRIKKLPVVEESNAKCYKLRNNIFIVQTGECLILEDKKFLVIGGATSIDKEGRVENISWWKEENPSYMEWNNVIDTINKYNEFDYIISHTTSSKGMDEVGLSSSMKWINNCPVMRALDNLQDILVFKRWYFGHWHENIISPSKKYVCLYESVVEVKDV